MSIATLSPEVETYVKQSAPTTAFNTDTKIIVGFDPIINDGPCRGWLRFNLSSIPAGSTINSAALKNTSYYGHDSYNPLNMDVALCSDITFLSTINWNTAPNGSVAGSPSASWNFTTESAPPSGIPVNLDVTADVIAQLAAGKVSWRLKMADETLITSIDGVYLTKYSYTANNPVLVIDYTVPATRRRFISS